MNKKAKHYIEKLRLKPHPEGGWYIEVYKSDESISAENMPDRYNSLHSFSTSIYFLLEGKHISAFHKLKSDELWHFYDGSTVIIYLINKQGKIETHRLGRNIDEDESFQITIKRDTWFAAELNDNSSFALVGCTVAPGFEFEDFELGKRDELLKLYPHLSSIITKLTAK